MRLPTFSWSRKLLQPYTAMRTAELFALMRADSQAITAALNPNRNMAPAALLVCEKVRNSHKGLSSEIVFQTTQNFLRRNFYKIFYKLLRAYIGKIQIKSGEMVNGIGESF